MNTAEILPALLAILTGSGFTAFVAGFWAYKVEATKGRREPMKAADLPTAGSFPGSHDFELLANALSLLTGALTRVALLLEGEAKARELDDAADEVADRRELREALRFLKTLQRQPS